MFLIFFLKLSSSTLGYFLEFSKNEKNMVHLSLSDPKLDYYYHRNLKNIVKSSLGPYRVNYATFLNAKILLNTHFLV